MFNWVLWYLTYKDDLYKLFLYYKQNQSIDKYIFLFFIICLIKKNISFISMFWCLFFKFLFIYLEHPTGSWFETPQRIDTLEFYLYFKFSPVFYLCIHWFDIC